MVHSSHYGDCPAGYARPPHLPDDDLDTHFSVLSAVEGEVLQMTVLINVNLLRIDLLNVEVRHNPGPCVCAEACLLGLKSKLHGLHSLPAVR